MTEAKLYVPKNADNYGKVVVDARVCMAQLYGGFTQYEGVSGWFDGDGQLVEEPVTVLETVSDHIWSDVRRDVEALARYVLGETDEDSVLASVDGKKIIVDESDEYDRGDVAEWAADRDVVDFS